MDWRDYRASLVARSRSPSAASTSDASSASPAVTWAHLLPGPEPGCILVANPLLFSNGQTYFDKAIILVIEHNAQGSMGIILNKPSDVTLGQVPNIDLRGGRAAFRHNRLHLGGDVGADAFYILHSQAVDAAVEVRPGVFLGGVDGVCDAVERDELSADSVKWFARYAGWGPGQLARECSQNVWYPVSCSVDLLLRPVERGADGRELWHSVMELVGDDYKRVSDQVRADVL